MTAEPPDRAYQTRALAAHDASLGCGIPVALPASAFLVRTFIVFHDCTHGSFLPSRRANAWLGIACGLLVYSPFHSWRHEHAVHHASAGDPDHRGMGGVEPLRGRFESVIALDLARIDHLTTDRTSLLGTFGAGLRGPQAEARLAARGLTLGHFPQSFEYATLGGFAAARSSGQASAGYGRFDELVVGLEVATPIGTLALGRAPRSAAGPDLRQLVLGSEGTLGVITSLTAQIRPAPQRRLYEGWRFESFTAGITALRSLAQDGPLPTVLRLSDEAETALNLPRASGPGTAGEAGDARGGCLAIVGYEGSAEDVAARRSQATPVLECLDAAEEAGAGESWAHERFRGPYLRDALLDAGAFVETLETATFWSSLPRLYEAVGAALREALITQGAPAVVLCHVSHVYRSGASLYFTVACAQRSDPVARWQAAKAAASDAILAVGATITHHHGVGTDHRDWYRREIGDVGIRALRAVKVELDPAGILNPGVLIAS